MEKCCRNMLDTAGIVREACSRHLRDSMTDMGGLTPAQKPPRRGEVVFFCFWLTEKKLPRISTTQGRWCCRPLKVCFLYL